MEKYEYKKKKTISHRVSCNGLFMLIRPEGSQRDFDFLANSFRLRQFYDTLPSISSFYDALLKANAKYDLGFYNHCTTKGFSRHGEIHCVIYCK